MLKETEIALARISDKKSSYKCFSVGNGHLLNFSRHQIDRSFNRPLFFAEQKHETLCFDSHGSIFFTLPCLMSVRLSNFMLEVIYRRNRSFKILQRFFVKRGLNRTLFLLLGLWPYQRTKLVELQTILVLGFLISSVVYQLAALIFGDFSSELIFKVFSLALLFSIYVIKYNSFRINKSAELQHVSDELKDEKEIDIMNKYGDNARRFTTIILSLHVCNMIVMFSLPLILYIVNVLLVNEYDPARLLKRLIPKYFVGQETYSYLIFLHLGGTACLGGTALVATGMMMLVCLKYVCGMIRIASYRIEKAMMVNTRKNVSMKKIMFTEIVHAIDIHRKANALTTFFLSRYEQSFFILILISVTSLTLNLYGISEALSFGDDIEELLVHSILVLTVFVYLFLLNYAGQEYVDHNAYVFSVAYNVRWYVAPLHIQKLILFLLQRGSKTIKLSIGMIFVLSLELFAMVKNQYMSCVIYNIYIRMYVFTYAYTECTNSAETF
ncbi:PREDICTED: uncharacterized protein LOC105560065 isoform X2 [Vollenhovia emeryi]|uniref:uncharacterized protein LOC105560065 isoform X2 n=1 Tax=Vollenhovia emeryi TaxID=411798 RepID=UPI0005F4994C|nr:PREDICTED: uncharacterized protein LOC105560065 isoform X2 [Vollenhovia emeryi]